MTENEILKLAMESGIIDITPIRLQVEEMQKQKILLNHNHEVWQGSNGYWYTYLDRIDGKRQLARRKEKQALEDDIVRYYNGEWKNPTFKDCFLQWSKEKLEHGEIQRQSYDRYEYEYKRFFEDFGKRRIANIDDDVLYEFITKTIHDQNLTAKAFSNCRTILLGVFKYAKRKKYTDFSISAFFDDLSISRGIYRRKKVTDRESVFYDDELELIYEEIEREPNILSYGVQLAIETGLRGGEIAALKYSDLKGNVLEVSKTEIMYRANGKNVREVREATKGKYDARKVVLLPQAVELIERIHRLNPNGEYLFEKNGKRIIAKCFTGKLYRMCNNAGIPKRSLHKLRKTYVTKLANANVPQKVICAQVGHTDFSTTSNYYWFNNQNTEQIQYYLAKAMNV